MARGRVMVPYQKKPKLWVGAGGSSVAFTADATVSMGSFAFTSPQTVLRMLMEYVIQPTAAPQVGDHVEICVAVAKVSTDALTAVTLPDPISEEGFPWLYWAVHPFLFRVNELVTNAGIAQLRRTIDIRTQRKFQSNESLVVVGQYFDNAGAPPITLTTGGMRVLTTVH